MMNRNDLRRADINLLVVFETMMHERNVSRVGEKLFLGQPAISAALGRLRHLFNDPLFIRTGRVMEPTSRAQEIYSNLTPALDSIAAALGKCQTFDPTTSEATFHIGLSDDVEYALLPCLLRCMRIEAPNITLVVRRADQWQLPQLLASGEISLGISHTLQLPANARCKRLRSIHPMLLRADSQPGGVGLDEFCRRPMLLCRPWAMLSRMPTARSICWGVNARSFWQCRSSAPCPCYSQAATRLQSCRITLPAQCLAPVV